MVHIERRLERIIELRFTGTLSVDEVKKLRSQIAEKMVQVLGLVLFFVDFRRCQSLDAEVLAMLLGIMRNDNRKVERSAHLFLPGTEVLDQMKGAINEARNPDRQAFADPTELQAWLTPLLTPAEAQQLQTFLAGVGGA